MDTKTVEVSIESEGADAKISSSTDAPKQRIAIVKRKRKPVIKKVWAKITAFVTGNAFFLWLEGKFDLVANLGLPREFWYGFSGLVLLGSLLWLFWEIHKANQERKMDDIMTKLLVEQNSTPENLVSVIEADYEALYRLKGYTIVTQTGSGMVASEEEGA